MKKSKYVFTITILMFSLFIFTLDVIARVGGADGYSGGYSSSSSGSSSGGGDGIFFIIVILIDILRFIPFPFNVIVGIIFVYIAYQFLKATNKKYSSNTVYNKIYNADTKVIKPELKKDFLIRNNNFNQVEFISKINRIFFDLNDAWVKQDISNVRKYISDGVYQRFNTQFIIMQYLKIKNTTENLKLKNVSLIKAYTDGDYDVIDVRISASNDYKYLSELDSSLNQGGYDEYSEYWSFVRKKNSKDVDMYSNNNCPNCSAPLENNLGEVSKCTYCNTILNSGEFDWVLSEITQEFDYLSSKSSVKNLSASNINDLNSTYKDFSIQLLEDKASNAYLQILTSRINKDETIMRRFVSDKAYSKIKSSFSDQKILYNRLFLSEVRIFDLIENNDSYTIAISLKASYQRVNVDNDKVELLDLSMMQKQEILLMSRSKNIKETKGLLYMHNCPNCGAPVENTTHIECSYCNTTLNSNKYDWIVDDILNPYEYKNNVNKTNVKISPDILSISDYALNNILVVAAADGVICDKEKEFAIAVATKLGYNKKKIQRTIGMALMNQLVVRMPEDQKSRNKIYDLMVKASKVSGEVTESEKTLLESIKNEYNINI